MNYPFLRFFSSLFFLPLLLQGRAAASINGSGDNTSFYENYFITWGSDHFELSSNNGQEVQLSLDRSSGSGFASKMKFRTGFFNMTMKLPKRDCAGVITAFYLTSNDVYMHDELDFEFLGNREGRPYVLQTNVFANGIGNREERILLWFDPTSDYHNYGILWNEYQIVFYVDTIPIRIFRRTLGVGYPTKGMRIEASLFNGEDWATDGGLTKVNWTHSPFVAYLTGFDDIVSGCYDSPDQSCYSPTHWWNRREYWRLNYQQQRELDNVRNKYRIYDYCSDKVRYPVPPRECPNR